MSTIRAVVFDLDGVIIDSEEPFEGKHYTLGRTLNVPQSLQRPHPPILIGGGGERKTLRLVAKYAQACNLFAGPELEHKLDVLKQHCENVGRDYDEIEKTCMFHYDLTTNSPGEIIQGLRHLAGLGFQQAHGSLVNAYDTKQFEVFRNEIIPAAAEL